MSVSNCVLLSWSQEDEDMLVPPQDFNDGIEAMEGLFGSPICSCTTLGDEHMRLADFELCHCRSAGKHPNFGYLETASASVRYDSKGDQCCY